jgi:hypothetical protein
METIFQKENLQITQQPTACPYSSCTQGMLKSSKHNGANFAGLKMKHEEYIAA